MQAGTNCWFLGGFDHAACCSMSTGFSDPPCRAAPQASLGITLVTITQRTALVKYHDSELRLVDGEGEWELRTIRKQG